MHASSPTNSAKIAFLIALILGTVIIFAVRQDRFIAISGAVLVILAYAVWASRAATRYGNPQQHADSVYYLDFLMTLVALLAATLPLASAGQSISADFILRQFGIGLVTTIV